MHSAFGHSPNSNWTPPNSTRHSGAGPGWALLDQFEKIRKIIIVTVNKCPEPSGQAFSPTPHTPKRARPKCRVHQRLWVFPNRPEKVKMSKHPRHSPKYKIATSQIARPLLTNMFLTRCHFGAGVMYGSNQTKRRLPEKHLVTIVAPGRRFFGKLAMPR